MVMRMLRWCGDTIVNFYLHSVEFGSIWLYLKPGEENAWGHLKEKCDLANVADMLDRVMITEDEMVRFFTDDGHNLQLSVFKEVTPTKTDPGISTLLDKK